MAAINWTVGSVFSVCTAPYIVGPNMVSLWMQLQYKNNIIKNPLHVVPWLVFCGAWSGCAAVSRSSCCSPDERSWRRWSEIWLLFPYSVESVQAVWWIAACVGDSELLFPGARVVQHGNCISGGCLCSTVPLEVLQLAQHFVLKAVPRGTTEPRSYKSQIASCFDAG